MLKKLDKKFIIIGVFVVIVLSVVAFFYMSGSNGSEGYNLDIPEDPNQKVTNVGGQIGSASKTNPYESTNPFDFKNPFE